MRASLVIVLAAAVLAPGCAAVCPTRRPSNASPISEGGAGPGCSATSDRATCPMTAPPRPSEAAGPGAITTSGAAESREVEASTAEVAPPVRPGSFSAPTPALPASAKAPDVTPATPIEEVEAKPDGPPGAPAERAPKVAIVPVAMGPGGLPPATPDSSAVALTSASRVDRATVAPAPSDDVREASPLATPERAPAAVLESAAEPAPRRDAESPPSPRAEAGSPKGRPVAQVGDEVITLPELTGAVKLRIAQLPPDASPTRREVIALAKSVLKGMVVRSLVLQEATDVLGGPARAAEAIDRLGKRWDRDELPALLKVEGVAGLDELRGKLANRPESPESTRDAYVVRSLALELMRRAGSSGDMDGYLDELRRRRPITSIMSQAELIAAGKRAAAGDRAAR